MPKRDDVAHLAQVSKTTVSRYLNKTGYVSASAAVRISAAIESLGYFPDLRATALKTGKTRCFLLVRPDSFDPFFSELQAHVESASRAVGYTVATVTHSGEDSILQHPCDGIILMSADPSLDTYLSRHQVPVVSVHYSKRHPEHPHIAVDIEGGVSEMIEMLLEMGHTRIGILTDRAAGDDARFVGYRDTLFRHHLSMDTGRVFRTEGHDPYEAGYQAALKYANQLVRCSAIFVYRDAVAVGFLAGLRDQGIRVPDDLSVASFDDIPISAYLRPALTTVRIPVTELGLWTVKALVSLINNEEIPPVLLPATPVLRDSVSRFQG